MENVKHAQSAVVSEFRALHESGCFVMPNPWDAGSAMFLRHLGFRALAGTSSGFAFTRGVPDGGVTRDATLAHLRDLVAATPLPVNADFQNGFAHDPEGVAENVALCVATGVAGLSVEDATGDPSRPLYGAAEAADRVRAARQAIDASGVPVVLTARCEAALTGHPDAARVAVERLVAFAELGADCLFAPGLSEPEDIAAIVSAVAPRPVNVLASVDPALSVARLADLGVRRISVGGALAAVAWNAFIGAARDIAEAGSFETLRQAAPTEVITGAFDA